MEDIKLWGVKVSPFARKIMIALHERQLPFQQQEILPVAFIKAMQQEVPPYFKKISPVGRIPILEINGISIADSAVIGQYLEKKFPNSIRLYPQSAEDFAEAIWLENFSDNDLAKVITRRLCFEIIGKPTALKQKPDKDLIKLAQEKQLPPLLQYLEAKITTKNYFVANKFSVADIAIMTQLIALASAKIELDSNKYPNLVKYQQLQLQRPSIRAILP